jgi:hypothetical protein
MCLDRDWIDTECEELERAGTRTAPNFTLEGEEGAGPLDGARRSPGRVKMVTACDAASARWQGTGHATSSADDHRFLTGASPVSLPGTRRSRS